MRQVQDEKDDAEAREAQRHLYEKQMRQAREDAEAARGGISNPAATH